MELRESKGKGEGGGWGRGKECWKKNILEEIM